MVDLNCLRFTFLTIFTHRTSAVFEFIYLSLWATVLLLLLLGENFDQQKRKEHDNLFHDVIITDGFER